MTEAADLSSTNKMAEIGKGGDSTLEVLRRRAVTSAENTVFQKLDKSHDLLEKLEQLRDQASKQSTLLSTQLKSVVHSQLGSISTGLEQMKEAKAKLDIVIDDLTVINSSMEKVLSLNQGLADLRREVYTYRQLALARRNIDYISDVPENVERAKAYLAEDNFLLAHKLILDLESSRNYLFFELYKTNLADGTSIAPEDKRLLNYFFQDVGRLSADLKLKLRILLSRLIETGRQAPEKLVTAFRIIEREEFLDNYWQTQEKETGFKLDDRPKQLKQMFEDVQNDFILRRIEGTQIDIREENKMWLVRHLELVRINLLNDLKAIKELGDRCFPPQYNILTNFSLKYHNLISKHLREIAAVISGSTEIFSLLQWVTQYTGKDCMGSPEIGLDLDAFPPLLDQDVIGRLTQSYMNTKDQELSVWMKRCIEQEVKDWYEQKELVLTNEGYLVSYLPATFEAMITQSLDVTISMDPSCTSQLLEICISRISEFRRLLQGELVNYCNGYFENVLTREKMRSHFTKQMVANANNSEAFPYILSMIHKKYDDPSNLHHARLSISYSALGDQFIALVDLCCSMLLKEIEMDLAVYMNRLMSKEWFSDTDPDNPDRNEFIIDTCLATFDDYFRNEYVHLKKPLLHIVCYKWHVRMLCYYLKGIFQHSHSLNILHRSSLRFNSPDERRKCANKMSVEADKLIMNFKGKDPFFEQEPYMFQLIKMFAELLRETDADGIVLELASMAKKQPSFTVDQAVSVLLLRGDFTKSEARERAEAAMVGMARSNEGIFAMVSKMDRPEP